MKAYCILDGDCEFNDLEEVRYIEMKCNDNSFIIWETGFEFKEMLNVIDIDYLQKALVERLYKREISSETIAVINQIIGEWKR